MEEIEVDPQDLAWAEYIRTYDEREFEFYQWCYTNNLDPESLDAALEYEAYYIEMSEEYRR